MKITSVVLFLTVVCSVLCGAVNPAAKLFEDDLVLYINFDDGKGAPLLMEGDIKYTPVGKVQFTDKGVQGRAFRSGKLSYKLDFNGVDFGKDTTFVFWMALLNDKPAFNSKTFNPISLQGKGASLLMQRQGWKKSANLLTVLAIPKKKGPIARVFNASAVPRWKVGQWHMVAVTWTAGTLSISVDGGKASAQTPMRSPMPVLYGDTSGRINSMTVTLQPNTAAIDEIMVFNRRLSAEELQQLYKAALSQK